MPVLLMPVLALPGIQLFGHEEQYRPKLPGNLLLSDLVSRCQLQCIHAGFVAEELLGHEKRLRARCLAIEQQAAQMTGSSFNLCSASQLANALYSTLKLPPPQQRADRYGLQSCITTQYQVDACRESVKLVNNLQSRVDKQSDVGNHAGTFVSKICVASCCHARVCAVFLERLYALPRVC